MWKMFLPFWPLDKLSVSSLEETSPFLIKSALVLLFFLNDSLWNFPSKLHSNTKGSYSHLYPELPSVFLRRYVSWGDPTLTILGIDQLLCPSAETLWWVSVPVGWVYVRCFDLIFMGSNVCIYAKHAVFYFSLTTPFSWTCLEKLSLGSWLTVSSHKATFSHILDSGTEEGRIKNATQTGIGDVLLLPAYAPNTPSQYPSGLGKHGLFQK